MRTPLPKGKIMTEAVAAPVAELPKTSFLTRKRLVVAGGLLLAAGVAWVARDKVASLTEQATDVTLDVNPEG